MTTKELLQHATAQAYNGDEMSLLCGVFPRKWVPPDNLIPDPDHNLTHDQACADSSVWYQPIWKILKHVADCKAMYATQAFGEPSKPFPTEGESLESLLEYLGATHQYLEHCVGEIEETDLAKPVPASSHGESAANLFWVLAQHDVSHGAQIQVIRDNL